MCNTLARKLKGGRSAVVSRQWSVVGRQSPVGRRLGAVVLRSVFDCSVFDCSMFDCSIVRLFDCSIVRLFDVRCSMFGVRIGFTFWRICGRFESAGQPTRTFPAPIWSLTDRGGLRFRIGLFAPTHVGGYGPWVTPRWMQGRPEQSHSRSGPTDVGGVKSWSDHRNSLGTKRL
jgi:hypothetical protein